MSPVPQRVDHREARELLSDGVRRRILIAILDGTLTAGERLHDDQLIVWLGVSRTPIRTALERLAESGLVEMEPNRFTRVATPTAESLRDALQVYQALQSSAIHEVVPVFASDALEILHEKAARIRGCDSLRGSDLRLAGAFFGVFSEWSANPVLRTAVGDVEVRLAFFVRCLSVVVDGASLAQVTAEILRGAAQRDPDAVSGALARFLDDAMSGS